jgi:hypothetical protein
MKRLALLALLVVACGATTAQAQTLTLGYHGGDTYKYSYKSTSKQTMVASGMTLPTDIAISAGEVVKVKSVDSSGSADLTITLSKFAVTSVTGGVTNTTSGLPDMTIDVKIAADGHILGMDGNPYTATNPFLAFSGVGGGFFITAVLPGNAVKPGDTWSKDYDQANTGGTGGIQVTSKSKYLRDESLQGVKAAVVETTSSGTIDMSLGTSSSATTAGFGLSIKGTMTSDVTTWIDPDGHRVLKTHSTAVNDGTLTFDLPSSTAVPGIPGPTTIKGTSTTDLTRA